MSTVRPLLGWRRVVFALGIALAFGSLLGIVWPDGWWDITETALVLGLVALLAFGLLERRPKRLPGWLPRWVLQVAGVAAAMPATTFAIWLLATAPGAPPFWRTTRMTGFKVVASLSLLLAPWAAAAALVREKEVFARKLERQALDARMHLLQAQVAPHFLFNTLANVQALVDAGSPRASAVLRSLTAYLRAAVPRLGETATTLGDELDLARAYLDLMHMRMPDRLQFEVRVDEGARGVRCPPMTLLTLVENAVRHGIDPCVDGGRIEVRVERRGERVLVRVSDTGVGLGAANGAGTGLTTLRERLRLAYGGDAELRLVAEEPCGVRAELDLPARGGDT